MRRWRVERVRLPMGRGEFCRFGRGGMGVGDRLAAPFFGAIAGGALREVGDGLPQRLPVAREQLGRRDVRLGVARGGEREHDVHSLRHDVLDLPQKPGRGEG